MQTPSRDDRIIKSSDDRIYPGGIHIALQGTAEERIGRNFLRKMTLSKTKVSLPQGGVAMVPYFGGIEGIILVSEGTSGLSEGRSKSIYRLYTVDGDFYALADGTPVGDADGVSDDWRVHLGCGLNGTR